LRLKILTPPLKWHRLAAAIACAWPNRALAARVA
jgi:hypothetical protein